MLKGLLDRARKAAKEHLPEEVVDAGRKLRDEVLERVTGRDEDGGAAAEAAKAATRREDPDAVLDRVRTKADAGLKPEDRLVVVYFDEDSKDGVAEIRAALAGIDTVVREMDLAKEPAQTRRQLANNTGVMVPPWVYINGRYWGGPGEMTSLRVCGDLELVVANRLDEIGDEAKRIGKVREAYSDDITVENILERWKLGHILCVDDLDAWFEVDKGGKEHFFYDGGPRAVEDMRAVAEEIVAKVEADEVEAHWQLEPSVHVG